MCSPWQYLKQRVKKIAFFQVNKSTHMFLGMDKYSTCATFQGKIENPTLVGAPVSFGFQIKRHGFRFWCFSPEPM